MSPQLGLRDGLGAYYKGEVMINAFCRVSGKPMEQIVDFGRQPLGNGFLSPHEYSSEYFYPMAVGFCGTSMMLQLVQQPAPEKMFHDHYAFYSSSSTLMAEHFRKFAEQVINDEYISRSDPFVVELGSNDGILLRNFARQGIRHLGIEPSLNVALEANKVGVRTLSEFFNEGLSEKIMRENGQADAILAANVMCHIPDILGAVKGIRKLLKPSGVLIFEDPYLGDIVSKTSYDQIYDEHVFLFSALSIRYLFGLQEMELIDVLPQRTHGGSMRYVVAHRGAHSVRESVTALLAKEREQGLDRPDALKAFSAKVERSRESLVALLKELRAQGKRIAGYGATSKSTTILNFCRIGPELIEFVSDTTPIKQGKFTPGTHIPVVTSETFRSNPPDYAVLFAWNHADEIMAKEKDFVAAGGKWIVHVPEVKVLP